MGTNIAKVSIDFSSGKYNDAALSVKTNLIVGKMDQNPSFPNTDPTIAVVEAANSEYFQALDNVKEGSREDTVIKNNLRKNLEELLKKLGTYVQLVSNGDEATILSSGFDVHKRRESVGPLDKPLKLEAKPGLNHGSIVLSCLIVKQAYSYVFEYRELPANGDNSWIPAVSTRAKVQIDGLTSGKQYAFRVAGVGADPVRNWSDEVNSFIL